jgi:polyhydroxyalkanoate synthesis regulator phasin
MSKKTMAATAGAVLALAGGAGSALADRGPGPHGPGGRVPGGPPDAAAIASYLGLTQAELRTQLQAGKSLAAIAKAQSKSISGLEDVIFATAKRRLDQAVSDGKLTAAQEATRLAELKSHLDDIVNRTGPPAGKGGPGGPGGAPFGAAAAKYLGLTAAELRTQLQSGRTLAQIATAQGKTVAGLKAAILADAKAHLDQAVEDGKLTAAQAKQRMDELTSHVDDIVNATQPFHPRR